MKSNVKSRKYYKVCYNNDDYDFIYTGVKCIYLIATKHKNKLLVKRNEKIYWTSINRWKKHLDKRKYIVEEISKEDLFLELL